FNNEIIGFCCAAVVEPQLTDRFNFSAEGKPLKVIEIYKTGLFDEYTGHGWGRFFVPQVMQKLFEDYEIVYLNTRDTNHKQVVPFYEGLGMHVLEREILEDDILPTKIEDRLPLQALEK